MAVRTIKKMQMPNVEREYPLENGRTVKSDAWHFITEPLNDDEAAELLTKGGMWLTVTVPE